MEEPRLRAVVEEAPIGIAVVAADGTFRLANAAYREITGGTAPLVGRRIFAPDLVGQAEIVPLVREVLAGGAPVHRREVPTTPGALAERRVLDLDLRPVPTGDGAAFEVAILVSDVTRRVAETERAELFHEAFRQSTNAMEVTDRSGVLVDVNPAFERIYGYRREELLGQKPNVVASPKTSREAYDRMWAALLDPLGGNWSGELLNVGKDGTEHPVLLSISAIRNPGGEVTHYVGIAVDQSERRAWERQAVHAERLASLGQLAAGVAHELNTPLANIMLVAESVQRKSDTTWVRDRMATIVGQTESAARIVRGLLDFSRRHEPQVRVLNLADVVRDSVGFLRGKQSEDVEVREEYARGPILVRGDRDQLVQVVTNILNNGYEAMEGTGELTVRVAPIDGRAEISIVDTGPGIPPEVLPHIFEPFFTTKSDRNGTGLGLAICHGLVESHEGTIEVESEPGHGARFTLRFPLVERGPA